MIIILLVSISTVSAICNCAEQLQYPDSNSVRRRLVGCNDVELQSECKRAEFEMVDFVNGVMSIPTISCKTTDHIKFKAVNSANKLMISFSFLFALV